MARGWSIEAWSRELGRGRITSDAGSLPFDAAVALVDDFVVGEPVEIVLVDGRVRRIAPVSARSPVAAVPLGVPAAWTDAVAALSALLGGLSAVVIVEARHDRLRLEIQHEEWPPPSAAPRGVAVFGDVRYVQLPMYSTRFARVTARSWASVIAERPPWLAAFSIELDEVDDDDVLACFEPDELGLPCGYVIARSLRIE